MRGNDQVIAQLNMALREELTAINQYFLHAEKLSERLLFLEATPKMEYLDLNVGGNIRAQLESDLKLEVKAVEMYNNAIAVSREAGDDASRELFSILLKDEEEHTDWIEAQLHQIKVMGYERYLALQTDGPKD